MFVHYSENTTILQAGTLISIRCWAQPWLMFICKLVYSTLRLLVVLTTARASDADHDHHTASQRLKPTSLLMMNSRSQIATKCVASSISPLGT